MKKIIYLALSIVFMFSLLGCNLFEDMDKQSESDSEVFYYNANLAINSGDQDKLAELETQIEERIISNPEEEETLTLMLAEVRLGLSGVDLLGTASKLFDIVNSADSMDDVANITSIITMSDEELAKLKLAVEAYDDLDTNPDVDSLTTETRNIYMNAGIANTLYAANLILDVFDVNGDGTVDNDDSLALFNTPAPNAAYKRFVYNGVDVTVPTYSEFIAFWNTQRPIIMHHLENSALYLNIALNLVGGTSETDNSKLTDTIEKIKTELLSGEYDDITEDEFDYIVNKILQGK